MPPLETEQDQDPTYELDQQLLHKTFSHVSRLLLKFEKNFEKEYLTALRARFYGNNSASSTTPLSVGDVVLLEAGSNRENWPLGRVLTLLPDPDGTVRAVRILCRGRESIQTLGKLVPLEIQEPAPPPAQVEEVGPPDEPEVPARRAQRPQRAAAQKATALNRQLLAGDTSDEDYSEDF